MSDLGIVGRLLAFCLAGVGAAVLITLVLGVRTSEGVHAGGADNFLIDMDPSAAPANTATSIGSTESCARIDENDALDADEDAVDTAQIDVVVGPLGIPQSNPMIAFAFVLQYPAGQAAVVSEDQDFLLASGPNSALFSTSEGFPDSDGLFESGAADLNTLEPGNVPETGPGVLTRIELQTIAGAGGVHDLLLAGTPAHVDPNNDAFVPDNAVDTDSDGLPDTAAQVARIAVNEACPAGPAPTLTPAPAPAPTAAPLPTFSAPSPSPTPAPSPTLSPSAAPTLALPLTPTPAGPASLPAGGGREVHSQPWPPVVLIALTATAAVTTAVAAAKLTSRLTGGS